MNEKEKEAKIIEQKDKRKLSKTDLPDHEQNVAENGTDKNKIEKLAEKATEEAVAQGDTPG